MEIEKVVVVGDLPKTCGECVRFFGYVETDANGTMDGYCMVNDDVVDEKARSKKCKLEQKKIK